MIRAFIFFLSQITDCTENWIQKQTEHLYFSCKILQLDAPSLRHMNIAITKAKKKRKKDSSDLLSPCSDWIVAPYATGILS